MTVAEPTDNGQGITQSEPVVICYFSITWDPSTNDFNIRGLDLPPWISIGMLEYALIQVRRRDAEKTIREVMKGGPRIVTPGRPF